MKALVTGASGFIGSHICRLLAEQGHEVRAMVRPTSTLDRLEGVAATPVYADVRDPLAVSAAVSGQDWVFHCAAEVSPGRREGHEQVNVEGTRTVAGASATAGVKRFVMLSSTAACGPAASREQPTTEAQEPSPVSRYGEAKLAAENAVRAMRDRLQSVILRLPAVYGPDDANTMIILNALRRGILLDPWGTFSVVYVKDAARAAVLAAQSDVAAGSVYLVSDGAERTAAQFAELGERVLGHRVVRVKVPGWFVFAVATVTEWLHPGGSYVNRDKARELVHDCWVCSPDKARAELGFAAEYTLERGLTETLEWCKEKGWQ